MTAKYAYREPIDYVRLLDLVEARMRHLVCTFQDGCPHIEIFSLDGAFLGEIEPAHHAVFLQVLRRLGADDGLLSETPQTTIGAFPRRVA
jgi:hypothetical protein